MTRILLIITLFFLSGSTAFSQTPEARNELIHPCDYKQPDSFGYARYPREALEKKIEGRIVVTLEIDSACYFNNIQQDTILGYGCEEAVREGLDKYEKEFRRLNRYRCDPCKKYKVPFMFEIE